MSRNTSIAEVDRRIAALEDERAELVAELSALRGLAFCGKSTALRALLRSVYDAALATTPVLVTGEVGVGKTSVAALLHDLSGRKDERFIAVRCAALPPTLQQVSIFGYVKGAFTGGLRKSRHGAKPRMAGHSSSRGSMNCFQIVISPDNARALIAHHWKGNLRELRCSIELAMIRSTQGATLNLQLPQ
jgi:DNA-binding NtrC family response regulator